MVPLERLVHWPGLILHRRLKFFLFFVRHRKYACFSTAGKILNLEKYLKLYSLIIATSDLFKWRKCPSFKAQCPNKPRRTWAPAGVRRLLNGTWDVRNLLFGELGQVLPNSHKFLSMHQMIYSWGCPSSLPLTFFCYGCRWKHQKRKKTTKAHPTELDNGPFHSMMQFNWLNYWLNQNIDSFTQLFFVDIVLNF